MKGAVNRADVTTPPDTLVPLEDVLSDELTQRPWREPDFKRENRALQTLALVLSESPRDILRTLAEVILDVTESDSAGLSLLTVIDGEERFYWPAIAGIWQPHVGGGTPRYFGPCGDVLDVNAPLLFTHPERRYTYLLPIMPPAVECLLVPFQVRRQSVGTVWAIAHDDRRAFDAEDLRLMRVLGQFAAAAYEVLLRLGDIDFPVPGMPMHPGRAGHDEGEACDVALTQSVQRLSPRERESLALLVAGYSYQETARRLSVTVKTVETYRRRLMHKLGITTRAELVAFALRSGILTDAPTAER
ncbi:MAG TPA: LuxR C-terminal-related transcriptional regulator [Gemmatimonadaceae bacterium]|nr:LuxR C-terminal-related transcriptional regulator [Gemmatimonadaceae bacterium]